jgi:beta-lactamase regulating signal transducer with metallopeptidase domain
MGTDTLSWFAHGAAWLWTFALHGSAILLATIVIARWWIRDAARLDLLWRYACFAGILTASVQCLVQDGPWLTLPIEMRGVAIANDEQPRPESGFGGESNRTPAAFPMPAPTSSGPVDAGSDPWHSSSLDRFDRARFADLDGGQAILADTSPPVVTAISQWTTWSTVGVFGASILALCGSLRWLRRRRRLAAWLRDRRDVPSDDPAHTILEHLRSEIGVRRQVRLTRSDRLLSPVAFGVLRAEICLPARAEHESGAPHVAAMLAHELAHLRRRDPLWLSAAQCVRALFPWQPLLGIAERRMRAIAERRCDAMAARVVGPVAIAECLVEVAGWVRSDKLGPGAMLASMAVARMGVRSRVEHLLQHDERDARRLSSPGSLVAVALLTAGFAAALPGASVRASRAARATAVDLKSPTALASDLPSAAGRSTAARLLALLAAFDAERGEVTRQFESMRSELRRLDSTQRAWLAEIELRITNLDRLRSRVARVIAERSEPTSGDGSPELLSENPR